MTELTARQQRFVEEYLVDPVGSQAAIRAGYSPRGAKERAWRLLQKPAVVAAIETAKAERAERTKIDADWLLTRLAAEAEADLGDLYDENGDFKPIKDWPAIWRQGLVTDVEISALYEGTGKERRQVGHVKKVKFAERLRRLELIGKHIRINAFKEIVEHKGLGALAERLERAQKRSEEQNDGGAK
ncbi:phage terminase small subunit [Rhizobium sp. BK529]|uniref:terminase small subunit n=1 Tax=unclassified Rhizobium TaxID=2613769 RepID=UPI001052F8C5|nr:MULTISPECIES: terminase small subunit [unclassified Rhizobium]MBB3590719.1 phage terminase small subunit [Rhizobium sp. BK529]TCS05409.1 phage terminase small subunit [Rhizobium sp. BK418]